ncbi:hypothetical protein C8R42DRAFT_597839 [Lentinula raphanica]|nr:hypothetical protein C8R42DRAFT_597839 [Lentinula raphanica]
MDELSIWADSTAAIAATNSAKTGPSHYILDLFHERLQELRANLSDLRVTISWVPGHLGVDGNERADQEAKRAAETRSSRNISKITLSLESPETPPKS